VQGLWCRVTHTLCGCLCVYPYVCVCLLLSLSFLLGIGPAQLKDQGNQSFKDGDYQEAKTIYVRALQYLMEDRDARGAAGEGNAGGGGERGAKGVKKLSCGLLLCSTWRRRALSWGR